MAHIDKLFGVNKISSIGWLLATSCILSLLEIHINSNEVNVCTMSDMKFDRHVECSHCVMKNHSLTHTHIV